MSDTSTEVITKPEVKTNLEINEPGMYKVIYINDNQTSMQFVIESLIDYFGYAEVQAENDLCARTHASFLKARKDIGSWTNLSDSPYIRQRNRALGV